MMMMMMIMMIMMMEFVCPHFCFTNIIMFGVWIFWACFQREHPLILNLGFWWHNGHNSPQLPQQIQHLPRMRPHYLKRTATHLSYIETRGYLVSPWNPPCCVLSCLEIVSVDSWKEHTETAAKAASKEYVPDEEEDEEEDRVGWTGVQEERYPADLASKMAGTSTTCKSIYGVCTRV